MFNDYQRIIVEGPDGAGKSTLTDLLQKHFEPTAFAHWTSPPKPKNELSHKKYVKDTINLYKQIGKTVQNHVIFDRALASEAVYGPIYRGIDCASIIAVGEKEMANLGWKQIYVTASFDTLKQRLGLRGDWLVNEEKLRLLHARYEEYMKHETKLPTFTYFTDLPNEDAVKRQAEWLLKWLTEK